MPTAECWWDLYATDRPEEAKRWDELSRSQRDNRRRTYNKQIAQKVTELRADAAK